MPAGGCGHNVAAAVRDGTQAHAPAMSTCGDTVVQAQGPPRALGRGAKENGVRDVCAPRGIGSRLWTASRVAGRQTIVDRNTAKLVHTSQACILKSSLGEL